MEEISWDKKSRGFWLKGGNNMWVEQVFEEEVTRTLEEMKGDKTLGLDSFVFFNIVGSWDSFKNSITVLKNI